MFLLSTITAYSAYCTNWFILSNQLVRRVFERQSKGKSQAKKEMMMKIQIATLVLMTALAGPSLAVMYEWKDPETGKYKAGDKPPAGVKHWIDGQRPLPEPKQPDCVHYNCTPPTPNPINRITGKRDATDSEKAECLQFVKTVVKYKDPDSVRVENTPITLLYSEDNKEVWMDVNAKNSYGAYSGSKIVKCKYDKYGILRDADYEVD